MLLSDLPPDLPLLLLATADVPLADLDSEALKLFGSGGESQNTRELCVVWIWGISTVPKTLNEPLPAQTQCCCSDKHMPSLPSVPLLTVVKVWLSVCSL